VVFVGTVIWISVKRKFYFFTPYQSYHIGICLDIIWLSFLKIIIIYFVQVKVREKLPPFMRLILLWARDLTLSTWSYFEDVILLWSRDLTLSTWSYFDHVILLWARDLTLSTWSYFEHVILLWARDLTLSTWLKKLYHWIASLLLNVCIIILMLFCNVQCKGMCNVRGFQILTSFIRPGANKGE
jgi:hypothetical protein